MKEKLILALKDNDEQYIQALIHEGLRFYPPVWSVSREIVSDVEIDDSLVKKGDIAFVFIYAMHRNADYWVNPDEFNPDRFLGMILAKV